MKNIFTLFITAIVLSLTACSSSEQTEVIETTYQQEQTEQSQQFTLSTPEVTEEPEYVIEADYDPALAQKAEISKRLKTEKTSPIALTSDDDDLEEDNDDLPSKVGQPSVSAYDYNSNREDLLMDSEFDSKGMTHKGITKPKKSTVEPIAQALFFVVAGAFKDEIIASKKAKEIEDLGYKVELISFDDEFKTICIAKLEDQNQADIFVKSLQKNKVDAYVVKRRKK